MSEYYVISLRCEYSDEDGPPIQAIRCASENEVTETIAVLREICGPVESAVGGRLKSFCPEDKDETIFWKIVNAVGYYAWIREIVSVKHVVETDIPY